MAVDFEAREWKDGASGGTGIDAASLNRIEQGVVDTSNAVNGLLESSPSAGKDLSPTEEISSGTDLDTMTGAGSWSCSDALSVGNAPEGVTGAFLLYVYEQRGGEV